MWSVEVIATVPVELDFSSSGQGRRSATAIEAAGVRLFSLGNWQRLRAVHGGLPACDELPWINSREAARLCQYSAPGRLLGEYPLEPRLRRDLLIAVTDGDLAAEAGAVEACLGTQFGAVRQLALVPAHVALRPIEFWLDLPGTPGWTSFAHAEKDVCFLFDGSTALILEGGLQLTGFAGR